MEQIQYAIARELFASSKDMHQLRRKSQAKKKKITNYWD